MEIVQLCSVPVYKLPLSTAIEAAVVQGPSPAVDQIIIETDPSFACSRITHYIRHSWNKQVIQWLRRAFILKTRLYVARRWRRPGRRLGFLQLPGRRSCFCRSSGLRSSSAPCWQKSTDVFEQQRWPALLRKQSQKWCPIYRHCPTPNLQHNYQPIPIFWVVELTHSG